MDFSNSTFAIVLMVAESGLSDGCWAKFGIIDLLW
jgi:hypothetical protein